MTLSSISAVVGSNISPARTPHTQFRDALQSADKPAHTPTTTTHATAATTATPTAHVLDSVSQAQKRMDAVLKMAESGRSFSAAELMALQTRVYQANQELDLAGKVVEKATGGVKQVLQTQV